MIVGVGGQGSLLASRILGSMFMDAGLDVKLSEVHGMAQRGGSVVTYMRAGQDIASPLIPKGEADVIISFERVEAARYLPWLKKGGTIVTSTQKISPMPVLTGAAGYPEGILEEMKADGVRLIAFDDALEAGRGGGQSRAANVCAFRRRVTDDRLRTRSLGKSHPRLRKTRFCRAQSKSV
jgi:indolepyruvate ferredoxin oxidoreductase beta subunit